MEGNRSGVIWTRMSWVDPLQQSGHIADTRDPRADLERDVQPSRVQLVQCRQASCGRVGAGLQTGDVVVVEDAHRDLYRRECVREQVRVPDDARPLCDQSEVVTAFCDHLECGAVTRRSASGLG